MSFSPDVPVPTLVATGSPAGAPVPAIESAETAALSTYCVCFVTVIIPRKKQERYRNIARPHALARPTTMAPAAGAGLAACSREPGSCAHGPKDGFWRPRRHADAGRRGSSIARQNSTSDPCSASGCIPGSTTSRSGTRWAARRRRAPHSCPAHSAPAGRSPSWSDRSSGPRSRPARPSISAR